MQEYERYLQTGMLGDYQPKRVCSHIYGNGKLLPVFRDANLKRDEEQTELSRYMMVGKRTFSVHSIFSQDGKTATDRLLKVIDDDFSQGPK